MVTVDQWEAMREAEEVAKGREEDLKVRMAGFVSWSAVVFCGWIDTSVLYNFTF